jgi:hypothetical protein
MQANVRISPGAALRLLVINTTIGSGQALDISQEATAESWEKLFSFVHIPGNVTVSDEGMNWSFVNAAPITTTGPIRIDFKHPLETKEPAISKSLEQRIRALALLEDGWLEGEGFAIPRPSVEWLIENVAQLAFSVRPGLSPTPEGNIVAEWSNGSWEASAEIDLRSKTVFWHALNVTDGQEKEESFQLGTSADWTRLQKLANEFSTE